MNAPLKISSLALTLIASFLLCTTPALATGTSTTSALAGLAKQASSLSEGSLDINSATQELLTAVPGIGSQLSEAIIKYREAHGAFKGIQDLLNVDGINAELIEKISPFLKF